MWQECRLVLENKNQVILLCEKKRIKKFCTVILFNNVVVLLFSNCNFDKYMYSNNKESVVASFTFDSLDWFYDDLVSSFAQSSSSSFCFRWYIHALSSPNNEKKHVVKWEYRRASLSLKYTHTRQRSIQVKIREACE